jgi:hypothetical protein
VVNAVEYEEVYLKAYQDGRKAKTGLGNDFRFYNPERPYQAWVTGYWPTCSPQPWWKLPVDVWENS